MEEVTLAVGWGGTIDQPTWRVDLSRFKLGEGGILTVDVHTGDGPVMVESQADEIVGAVMSECYRMLKDEFVMACTDHEIINCDECAPVSQRRGTPF